jgi:hypothetical protein
VESKSIKIAPSVNKGQDLMDVLATVKVTASMNKDIENVRACISNLSRKSTGSTYR